MKEEGNKYTIPVEEQTNFNIGDKIYLIVSGLTLESVIDIAEYKIVGKVLGEKETECQYFIKLCWETKPLNIQSYELNWKYYKTRVDALKRIQGTITKYFQASVNKLNQISNFINKENTSITDIKITIPENVIQQAITDVSDHTKAYKEKYIVYSDDDNSKMTKR